MSPGSIGQALPSTSVVAPERVYPYVSAASALIVLGIGTWLVGRAVARRAHEHAHAHGHAHGHPNAGPSDAQPVGWRALVALGVSGGLVPSASAVLLLLAGLTLRRPDLGVLLIVMFGAGMAAVLVGLGLSLVGAARVARRRFGQHPVARRVASLVPAATAVTVLLLGIALSIQAGQQIFAASL